MNIIFKGLCPICHNRIIYEHKTMAFINDYYYCANLCYQIFADGPDFTQITVNVPGYIIQYYIENGDTKTVVIDDYGSEVLILNTILPVNWKDTNETSQKIKNLVIFS